MEGSGTVTLVLQPPTAPSSEDLSATLETSFRLLRIRDTRKVHWEEGTVDNEGRQRKSSKCCCIFTKRRGNNADDDDDDSDDEFYERKSKPVSKEHKSDCSTRRK